MADLVAVVFPSEEQAEKARQTVYEMKKDYLIEIGDAAIAVKSEKGVKLNQMMNLTAAGAAGGSFWGLLVGVLFLNPLLGVAAGAASGALAGKLTDLGVNDKFMKEIGSNVEVGEAVLFVLVTKVTGDKALERLRGTGGRVLQTSLDNAAEERLRETLAQHVDVPDAAPAST